MKRLAFSRLYLCVLCGASLTMLVPGHAATVTFRARYVDHLNNVGPWGPPESCSVTA